MRPVDFTLACDIMMDLEGSIRPAIYLAVELASSGHTVSMISPIMSDDVEQRLSATGIVPINLHGKFAAKNTGLSLLWLETWAREAFLKLNSRRVFNGSSTTINFSQVISIPSSVWYLQGPPSVALEDMEKELSPGFRIAYNILRPMIRYADAKLVNRMEKASALVIANSKFCASMYSDFGVKVHDVVYPPIDCRTFHPRTSSPSSSYVLTYFGKETKFSVVKRIADKGVEIKAFGSKTQFIPESLTKHSRIEFLGRVTTDELVDLYSNALFTLFPFTHEPFGYVPLESMACGTPVLTYDIQGPSECVVDGHTGWLAHTDVELERKAARFWQDGVLPKLRQKCVKEASKYDRKLYIGRWLKILDDPSRNSLLFCPSFDVLKSGCR
jgi:hypothetical protein